jgi:prevent-host-death family protein
MKTISDRDAQSDLERLLDSAQEERIVITRNGRPSAVVLGLESYDAEDLSLAGSPDFWQMIERRRRQGSAISLAEARARLEAKERQES